MHRSHLQVERSERIGGDPWVISLLLLWTLWAVHGWQAGATSIEPAPARPALSTIDPNTAPWWELTVLPGIGEQRARAIVAFREATAKAGAATVVFRSAEDLAQVRGIGPRTVERIKPHLRFPEENGQD